MLKQYTNHRKSPLDSNTLKEPRKIAISNPEIAPTDPKIATTDPETLLNYCENCAILKQQLQKSKKWHLHRNLHWFIFFTSKLQANLRLWDPYFANAL